MPEDSSSGTEPAAPAVAHPASKRLVIVLAALAAALGYYAYQHYSRVHPSTDDAYVNANVTRIAPQVGGPVRAVHVEDHQFVRRGTVLLEIDSTLYQVAVEAARAQLDTAVQSTDAGAASVRASAAAVRQQQAALNDAQTELTRLRALFTAGAAPRTQLDSAFAAATEAGAAFDAARAQLDAATAQLGPGAGDANARVRAAAATLQRAELDLAHTRVTAPSDGWIANLSLRPGAMVAEGASVMALVENERWWVDANFKETDLARISPGQPARIWLDMYPDMELTGTVRALSIGSGAAFSLLPPENASGNWVKVTQRFSVRVDIEHPNDDPGRPLRVGASASVRIDTSPGAIQDVERSGR